MTTQHLPVTVLAPSGDLDAATLPWLRDQIQQHLAEVGEAGHWLVLDFSRTGFVGSGTLEALLQARTAGAHIRLHAVPRALRRLITATGLDDLFRDAIAPDEASTVTTDPRRNSPPTAGSPA